MYEGAVTGRFGNRKPPSSAYATTSPIFHFVGRRSGSFIGGNFWDGRATGEKLGNPAADQAQGPFLNPLEQNNPDAETVVNKVCASSYAALFYEVWGTAACDSTNTAYDYIALSIAAYEDSAEVNQYSSKYDSYLAKQASLSNQEKQGLDLFKGKGKCTICHAINNSDGLPPQFTDFTFHNLGVPRNPENPFYDMADYNPLGAAYIDPGLGEFLAMRMEYAHYARENYGKHKVPTLRNVDKRPDTGFIKAFGHNGYFKA